MKPKKKVKAVGWAIVSKRLGTLSYPPAQYAIYHTKKEARAEVEYNNISKYWEVRKVRIEEV